MSDRLDALLGQVRKDASMLLREASDRQVIEAVIREAAPVVTMYKLQGRLPGQQTFMRLATYLIALAAAFDSPPPEGD